MSVRAGARARVGTPGPPVARGGAKVADADSPPSFVATAAGDSATAAGDSSKGARSSLVEQRRHTDVCCILFFVAFNFGLLYLAYLGRSTGDIRRFSHGFDFQGHLCGDPVRERSRGSLLYWCSSSDNNGNIQVRWDAPICVDGCPQGDNQLLCPKGSPDVEEQALKQGGGVVLVSTSRQQMLPMRTVATRRVGQYCLPVNLGQEVLKGKADRAKELAPAVLMHSIAQVSHLIETPILVACIASAAVVAGFVWILMLRRFAKMLYHIGFAAAIFSLWGSGLVTILSAPVIVMQMHVNAVTKAVLDTLHFRIPDSKMLTVVLGPFDVLLPHWNNAAIFWDMSLSYFESILPHARLLLGMMLLCMGCVMLLWYCYAFRSISVAADSMRESCCALMRHPTLLVLLPMLEIPLQALVACGTLYGAMLAISSAEVSASSLHLFGETFLGVPRSVSWSARALGGVLCWGFAFLWLQELVAALRSFILSYTSVNWYFTKETTHFPIFRASCVGLFYHSGSLMFGAFQLALIRMILWLVRIFHKMSTDQATEKKGRLHCIFALLEGFVIFSKEIMQRISEHAYTDLVLTSTTFPQASRNAAELMLQNASLIGMVTFLRPAKFLAQCAFAVGFGGLTWLSLVVAHDTMLSKLPMSLQMEVSTLDGFPVAPALLATSMCFLIVRAFSATIDGVSDAVLYCFLWDKSDGTLDSTLVPASFVHFVRASGVRVKEQ